MMDMFGLVGLTVSLFPQQEMPQPSVIMRL